MSPEDRNIAAQRAQIRFLIEVLNQRWNQWIQGPLPGKDQKYLDHNDFTDLIVALQDAFRVTYREDGDIHATTEQQAHDHLQLILNELDAIHHISTPDEAVNARLRAAHEAVRVRLHNVITRSVP